MMVHCFLGVFVVVSIPGEGRDNVVFPELEVVLTKTVVEEEVVVALFVLPWRELRSEKTLMFFCAKK